MLQYNLPDLVRFNLTVETVPTGRGQCVMNARMFLHILQHLMVIYLHFHSKPSTPGLSITISIISTQGNEMMECILTCNLLLDVLLYQRIYTGFPQCHQELVQRQR